MNEYILQSLTDRVTYLEASLEAVTKDLDEVIQKNEELEGSLEDAKSAVIVAEGDAERMRAKTEDLISSIESAIYDIRRSGVL